MQFIKDKIRRWRATWQPDMYHGWGKTRRYFEGWYIKIVDNTEGYALAFIPGISMSPDGTTHAFIQVLDGKQCTSAYHRFEATDFVPSDTEFNVQIAGNQFSTQKLKLDLPNISGTLILHNPTPWTKMFGAPGIMGWFSFVPFMECYHGVVSLNHRISGTLMVNGKAVNFDNGRGYIEKDWGISFPRGWIWLQSNHFFDKKAVYTEGGVFSATVGEVSNLADGLTSPTNLADALDTESPISLIASVAYIPFLGTHFIGYIVGFWYCNKLHRFATYTGAKMTAQLIDNQVFLSFKDHQYQLDITATKGETGNLISPIKGEMTGKMSESLQGELHIRFYEKEALVYEGTGRHAGLEVAGEVDVLLTSKWRR
jgi:tocopherol cyclase